MRATSNLMLGLLGAFLASLILVPTVRAQALIDMESGRGLFDNVKAVSVGDIVTIIIVENASANTQTSTDTNNKTEVSNGPGLGLLDMVSDFGFDSENKYKGTGKSARSGTLTARISAHIIERLPNGNLRLEGQRVVEVNSEKQIITLRGLIRPRDVGSDNTVLSTYIADAEIVYTGQGTLADAHEPGVFTRLLNWLF